MNDHLYQLLISTFETRTCDYVFPNVNGDMIKERRALRICKEIAVKAGITSRVYLHKFRSTYATLLVRNNVSLESIKELLGHASLVETGKAYANNESNHLHTEVKTLDGLLKHDDHENRVHSTAHLSDNSDKNLCPKSVLT